MLPSFPHNDPAATPPSSLATNWGGDEPGQPFLGMQKNLARHKERSGNAGGAMTTWETPSGSQAQGHQVPAALLSDSICSPCQCNQLSSEWALVFPPPHTDPKFLQPPPPARLLLKLQTGFSNTFQQTRSSSSHPWLECPMSPQPPTHSQECELSPYTRDKRRSILKSLPISVSFPTALPTTNCSYLAHLSQTLIRKQPLVLKHADPPPGKSRPIFAPPSPSPQRLIWLSPIYLSSLRSESQLTDYHHKPDWTRTVLLALRKESTNWAPQY